MMDPAKRPLQGGPAEPPKHAGKRPYSKPRLTEYGSVAKLTQGTRTRSSDSPAAGFKMTCL